MRGLILGAHHALTSLAEGRLTGEVAHLSVPLHSRYEVSALCIEVVGILPDLLDVEGVA